jgi:eukaryotic-like serine/threonine-protein kinase
MPMVYVPAGSFLMGSTENDINTLMANCPVCDRDYFQPEIPQHPVYLDAYWIDKTEVTNAMYAQCVASGACGRLHGTGSYTRSSYYGNELYADYPVVNVDWDMANAYCTWAGRRLPSEAEWEKAARGTDGGLYPWGNQSPTGQLANYDGIEGDTTQVGSYPLGASPYGALDLAGNVWEWVNDWFGENYYAVSPGENPSGPNSGTFRGLHGGSWALPASDIRSAFRGWGYYWGDVVGFRCAVSKASQ